jgi:hypothetical protein
VSRRVMKASPVSLEPAWREGPWAARAAHRSRTIVPRDRAARPRRYGASRMALRRERAAERSPPATTAPLASTGAVIRRCSPRARRASWGTRSWFAAPARPVSLCVRAAPRSHPAAWRRVPSAVGAGRARRPAIRVSRVTCPRRSSTLITDTRPVTSPGERCLTCAFLLSPTGCHVTPPIARTRAWPPRAVECAERGGCASR